MYALAGMSNTHFTRHTSHVTRHTSYVTRHTSHVTRHTSHVTRHTSHVIRHTTLVELHTSHVTRHTSHVTRHTSHITRQTSNVTTHHFTCLTSRDTLIVRSVQGLQNSRSRQFRLRGMVRAHDAHDVPLAHRLQVDHARFCVVEPNKLNIRHLICTSCCAPAPAKALGLSRSL